MGGMFPELLPCILTGSFPPTRLTRRTARELYESVASLPLVCPHGHVDARLFSDPAASFGSPADLFIIPDHYITRMLYSQGIPLESLGVPSVRGWAGGARPSQDLEQVLRELPFVPRHAFRPLAGELS